MPFPTDRVLFGAAYYHEYQPHRTARGRPRPDGRGPLHRHPGRRVRLVHLGAGERRVRPRLAPAGPRRRPRSAASPVILGTPTYAVPPWLARRYPEIAAERRTGQRDRLGRPAGGRLHPPGVPLPRRTGHPQDRRPVRRPPGRHRLPGRQRARQRDLLTTTASSSASSTTCATSTATSRPSTASGAWSTGRTGCPPGPTCGRRTATPSRSTTWPGGASRRELTTEFIALAGRHRPRVRARRTSSSPPASPTSARTVRGRRADRPPRRHRGQPVLRDAGRACALPDRRAPPTRTGPPTAPGRCTATRGPDVLLPPGAVPGHRDQRPGHRLPVGQPARLRRPVAAGRLGAGLPRRRDDRVLALAHPALRRRDLLGRHPPAQRQEPGRDLPANRGAGRRVRRGGRPGRRPRRPDADIAMVYSNDSKWALQKHPPAGRPARRRAGPRARTRRSSTPSTAAPSTPASSPASSTPASCLRSDPAQYAAAQPVLVAAGFAIADDEELEWLRAYAEAGGHLVLGIRTGYADHEARARAGTQARAPGRGRRRVVRRVQHVVRACGCRGSGFGQRRQRQRGGGRLQGRRLQPEPGCGRHAVDRRRPAQGAQVLASYDHVHFGRWPALTTNAHGKGRITYVGTVPNEALARDILQWAARDQGDWRPQTASQTVTGATARDGRRLRFVHNWSWTPGSFKLPGAVDGRHQRRIPRLRRRAGAGRLGRARAGGGRRLSVRYGALSGERGSQLSPEGQRAAPADRDDGEQACHQHDEAAGGH